MTCRSRASLQLLSCRIDPAQVGACLDEANRSHCTASPRPKSQRNRDRTNRESVLFSIATALPNCRPRPTFHSSTQGAVRWRGPEGPQNL